MVDPLPPTYTTPRDVPGTSVVSSSAVPENTAPYIERVCWVYIVGATGLTDLVVERRISVAPKGGLICRVVGPGIVGRDASLDEPQVLGFEVRIEAVTGAKDPNDERL